MPKNATLTGDRIEIVVEAVADGRVRLRLEVAGLLHVSDWLGQGDTFEVAGEGVFVAMPVTLT